jgi:hypothetical protein
MSEVCVIGASCTGLGTRAGTGSQAQYRCGRGAEQVLAGRQVGLPLSRVTRAMRSLPGEGAGRRRRGGVIGFDEGRLDERPCSNPRGHGLGRRGRYRALEAATIGALLRGRVSR